MTKFIHDSEKGYTAAYEVSDNSVAYAIAFCSVNDTFSKKIGRKVSEGRLMLGLSGSDRRKVKDNFFIEDIEKGVKPAQFVRKHIEENFFNIIEFTAE